MNYPFKILCLCVISTCINHAWATTSIGGNAEKYWASKLSREKLDCGISFDAFFSQQQKLTQDQIMQLEIVYKNALCYMDRKKPSKINDMFFAWRKTHENHDFIQEDIAYFYYQHVIALFTTYIFWQKKFGMSSEDALILEAFSLKYFLSKAQSLDNSDFIKKYNSRSVFLAYQKYVTKDMLNVLSFPYIGGDVQTVVLYAFQKYQDNGTVLLYNEKPL